MRFALFAPRRRRKPVLWYLPKGFTLCAKLSSVLIKNRIYQRFILHRQRVFAKKPKMKTMLTIGTKRIILASRIQETIFYTFIAKGKEKSNANHYNTLEQQEKNRILAIDHLLLWCQNQGDGSGPAHLAGKTFIPRIYKKTQFDDQTISLSHFTFFFFAHTKRNNQQQCNTHTDRAVYSVKVSFKSALLLIRALYPKAD